ncbi:MAG: hypothetical protein GX887_02695 [Firmicutes bacterium]|nr:hypothetical protein [Bacillota bacterium]
MKSVSGRCPDPQLVMGNQDNRNRVFQGNLEQLEAKLFEEISSLKSRDPMMPIKVVVNSNLVGVYLRRMLVLKGLDHANVHFCTLGDMARELAERYGRDRKRTFPYHGEEWICRILAREIPSGSYFEPVRDFAGFSKALRRTFQELQEAGIENIEADTPKNSILHLLYRDYNRRLDRFAAPFLPVKDLPRSGSAAGSLPRIMIYGLYRFNNRQKEWLGALASIADMTFFLPRFVSSQSHGHELLSWFETHGFEVEKEEDDTAVISDSGIARLQDRLFSAITPGNGDKIDDDRSFQIWSAPGEVKEAEEIGRQIIRFADEGYSFHEMAVLVKDAQYYSLLAGTFEGLELPYYMPMGRRLHATRVGMALMMSLQLCGGMWERKEVMELLDIAPFDYERVLGAATAPSISLWDHLAVMAGITEGINNWEQGLDWLYKGMKNDMETKENGREEDREQLSQLELFRLFIKQIHTALAGIPGGGTWTDIIGALEKFIEDFFLEGRDCDEILKVLLPLKGLDTIEEGKVDFRDAREMVLDILKEAFIPHGSFQQGVTVCSLDRAQNLRFKIVFVPGVQGGTFPGAVRQDPLIPDEERKQFDRRLALRREALAYEALSFAGAINSAGERLILSFPRFNSRSGDEQMPSRYLLRAAEVAMGSYCTAENIPSFPGYRYIASNHIPRPRETIFPDEFERSLIRSGVPGDRLNEYFAAYYPWFAAAQKAHRQRQKLSFTMYEGMMGEEGMKGVVEDLDPYKRHLSVTFMGDYLRCPYRFFLRHLLGLELPEEAEGPMRIEPLTRGSLVHEILEKFYQRAGRERILPPDEGRLAEALAMMEEVLENCFRRAEEEGGTGHRFFWKVDRKNIRDDMLELVRHEVKLGHIGIPTAFEIPFDIAVKLEDGRAVCFRGRIDRLDRSEDEINIIDYKTGRPPSYTKKDMQEGLLLQLAVYILAAKELGHVDSYGNITASFYFVSRDAAFQKVNFTGANLAEKMPLFEQALAVVMEGISGGKFFPYSLSEIGCSFCDYLDICGHDIRQVYRRKEEDPRIRGFRDIVDLILF